MKTYIKFAIPFFLLLVLVSCRKDEFIEDRGELITVTAHLSGVVLDTDKQPIVEAMVSLSGKTTTTDKNGAFSIKDVDISKDGSLVRIDKFGYFDGYYFAQAEANEQSFLDAVLIERVAQEFESSTGATITTNGGATIEFAPNTIMTGGGNSYDGTVSISAYWYDPSSPETGSSMPGDLRAIAESGELVQLQTYGMMAVELRSPSGVELQLATGSKATLKFPFPQGSDARVHDQIPLWHLDEETGHWIEEGFAKAEGDFLVGEVSHFSFWNCDIPFPYVNITGRLVGDDGLPLAYQKIIITDNNNNISRSGVTNESGVFSGKVPADVDLSMFHHVCGQSVSIADLGSLTSDIDLGDVTTSTANSMKLSAILEDCQMQPITNGYVKISSGFSSTIVNTTSDGALDYRFFDCNYTDITLQGFDYLSTKVSAIIPVNTTQTEQDFGNIALCDNITGQYARYTINGVPHGTPIDVFTAFFADDRMLYVYAYSTSGGAELLMKYDVIDGFSQYYVRGHDASGNFLDTSGENIVVQSSAIGGVGTGVTLNFDNGVLEGEVFVIIDEVVESGTVKGRVWFDEDKNGLQDAGEPGIAGREVLLTYTLTYPVFLSGSSYYPYEINQFNTVQSDSDGNFEFEGVFVNKGLRLTYFADPAEELTIHNAGADNIDSDFYDRFSASVNGRQQFNTADFILDNGGEKLDFGLGFTN